MKAERQKQIALVPVIGHSALRTPKAAHSANPVTVSTYIRVESADVSPDFTTFHACGTKLLTEQIEAR